ncbi:chorismate synthase [Candidatus Micrarchaeota archaeon]|nr:chorismate synthase [Candidatus Micrarchaeota archaeon]
MDARPFEFGNVFHLKVFGSSHGPNVGVEVTGCPKGIAVSADDIQAELDKRKPGQSALTTQRKEDDRVIIESGLEDGATTGGVIRMLVENKNIISAHYDKIKDTPRPGHADYPARVKYGLDADLRGGAFFSGRMTAAFVMAGALAKKILEKRGIKTMAFAKQIGAVGITRVVGDEEILGNTYNNLVRTAAGEAADEMIAQVESARKDGDSVGGVIECRITGLPAGVGEPMFESIESVISKACFAIPAVKGVEFGSGFAGSSTRGSQNNDEFLLSGGKIVTKTNNSGGILGGLSDGMPVVFRVAIKPTASIFKKQQSVNLRTMQPAELLIEGRHDPCIAIRAVPVVESVAAFCILDILLSSQREE